MVHQYSEFKGLFTMRESECESEKDQTEEMKETTLNIKEIFGFHFHPRLV